MEKVKRNHIFSILEDFINKLIKSIIPLFILFSGRNQDSPTGFFGNIVLLIFLFFMAVTALLNWYKNIYQISENFILSRTGIFVIQRREIPFSKIQTINISQNLIQRILNLAALKIDTGNSTLNRAEFSIKIKKSEAESIKATILETKNRSVIDIADPMLENVLDEAEGEIIPDGKAVEKQLYKELPTIKQYRITPMDLLVAGLTSNAVLAGFAFIATIFSFLDDFLAPFLDENMNGLSNYIDHLNIGEMTITRVILLGVSLFLVFVIFSLLLSLVGTFIKYYGFTAKRENRNLVISYGLFEKKSFTIPVSKIKAVYVKQSLFRQLLGLYAIQVESIGYGNEQGEEAMVFPVASAARKRDIIRELLPEYFFEEELQHVPKMALRRFVLRATRLPVLFSIILTAAFSSYGWLSFILLPVFILKGFMEYRNSAVGLNSRLLCLNNGAFTKSSSLMAVFDIQSVSDQANYFQKRRGLFNYRVSIQSNIFGKTIMVRNLNDELKEKLMGMI